MKENLQIITFIFIIILMITIGEGCGKKAPPIPPAEKKNINTDFSEEGNKGKVVPDVIRL
jgi:predicted small lipoprotein YifL